MSYATMADQMAIANQGRQNAMSQARKFIRNPHVAPNPHVTPISQLADIDELDTLPVTGTGSVRQMNHGPPAYEQYQHMQQPPSHFFHGHPGQPIPSPQFLRPPPFQKESFEEDDKKLNCIDIAEHVKDCPICSKFYKRDNALYIIVIVVLAIITILLLKRVLNI
uniref:Uncharacterized protein n=1 Tax=Iridovirus LCIVAC01 TaxID=2506607 RepID=A0A481YQN1_9VIRU|nr:MAG: hypothetical protein LCIVAC01_01880 [Iridovirus LCIVAC01]